MPRLTATKRLELQRKFADVDRSGDNKLSYAEMRDLLMKGNPDLEEAELKKLYSRVDKNGDGSVDFDEFVAYLYDASSATVAAPDACKERFTDFSGAEMDGTEFSKLCVDCQLLDQNFKKTDVAMTFAKVVPRGKRCITLRPGADGFSQYDKLLCLVAEKKGCSPSEVHARVAAGQKTLSGTKTENVRFHDDKSLYTGSHAAVHGVTKTQAAREFFDIGPEGDWSGVEATYKAFDKDFSGLDSRAFAKCCEDAGLLDSSFSKGDADVAFSSQRTKKIDFEHFKEALRKVAEKKQQQLRQVQSRASWITPQLRHTIADAVRLNDDKSTYTGIHAGK